MTHAYTDAHAALLDDLDARVRETVRRDGVDPQAEVGAVRRIAERVVTSHEERSLTGQVAPVPDVDSMVGELVARVSGFGPLQPYLDDPTVEEFRSEPPPAASGSLGRSTDPVDQRRGPVR
jgi:pilus assembly protein CpaF